MQSKEWLSESAGEERIKVSLVIWKAAAGGIEKSLFNYLDHLGEEIDFTIYSLRPVDKRDNLFSGRGVNLCCGDKRNIILYWKFLFYALGNRDRVFHLFNAGPVILFLSRLARVKKIIYHIRGTIYWRNFRQKVKRKISWFFALNRKVRLLSNSGFSKKRFLEQVSARVDIEVLYNPFAVGNSLPQKKTKPGKLKIAYVGRLAKGKNLFAWLDAAEHILKQFPRAGFRIVGEGGLREKLAARIKEKGLTNHIKMAGYIPDVDRVYRESDLLLFLSENESFGNVVVESILNGTPVIASAIPAMKEIFVDYPEFLVELDEHLFESIVGKLKDYDALRDSASRAREDFVKKFNVGNHIGRINQLYAEAN